ATAISPHASESAGIVNRATFQPGIRSSVRPSHGRLNALANVASMYNPPKAPAERWNAARRSLLDNPMKKVCPNEENRVSRKPPASHLALSRRNPELSRRKSTTRPYMGKY